RFRGQALCRCHVIPFWQRTNPSYDANFETPSPRGVDVDPVKLAHSSTTRWKVGRQVKVPTTSHRDSTSRYANDRELLWVNRSTVDQKSNATILGTQGSRQVSAALWDGSSLHLAAQARVQCSAHFTVGATVASVCMAGGLS
ncbi:hypothetical protein IAQ61_009099, partial [Plenodomus lingam]|uniref:uncharacterized protein n=1 Tax=Leptosphaeria maculans TaxID=5022 RepID=UPI003326801D